MLPRHICSFSVAKTPGPRQLTKKRFVWPHGSRGVRVQDGREAGQPVTGKVAEQMLRAHTKPYYEPEAKRANRKCGESINT